MTILLRRFLASIFALLALLVLVTVSVTNRNIVTLVLDPFTPDNPVLALQLPLFAYLIAMLILGAIIGGTATWLGQAKWRKLARQRNLEAMRWKGEADRLLRERDAAAPQARALTVAR